MFPLLALAALAGFAGYQYSKARNSGSNTTTTVKADTPATEEKKDTAKNIYNYYTSESENGNTLFGSQKKTKRTLFGGDTL